MEVDIKSDGHGRYLDTSYLVIMCLNQVRTWWRINSATI